MSPHEEGAELQPLDYLHIVRRRKLVVALAVLVVVGTALASSYVQTPIYQARAQLLFQPRATDTLFDPNTGVANDPARAVSTQLQVIRSRPVQDAVRARLGRAPTVTTTGVGQTDVIAISAQSTDPAQAATVANAYAEAYVAFLRSQAVNDLLAAAQQIQAKISDLQAQLDSLNAQVDAAPASQRAAAAANIAAQRDSLLSQQSLFKQKLDQTQVDAALKSGGAQIVSPATPPTHPIKPRPRRTIIIALVVGLAFGVGVAFLIDYIDDSILSKEDLERASHGDLTVLGLIPLVPAWRNRTEPRVVSLLDPKSQSAEAYRSLRTSIQFLAVEQPVRTLQITSGSAGEGKTTTLANLAVAVAGTGRRVVVSCADLRRPRIHEFFGLDNAIGFTSVMLGEVPLSAAIQEVPGVDGLFLLASGPLPPNPSELLSSARAAEVLAALRNDFEMVLIDSPPVLPVTDAAVLSSRVDATLFVTTVGNTTRRQVSRSMELLRQVDAPIIGTVLNGVTSEGGYGYAYSGYGYGYGYYGRHAQDEPVADQNGTAQEVAPR